MSALTVAPHKYHGPGWTATLVTGWDDDEDCATTHDFQLWAPWERPDDDPAKVAGLPAHDRIGYAASWNDETGERGNFGRGDTAEEAMASAFRTYPKPALVAEVTRVLLAASR